MYNFPKNVEDEAMDLFVSKKFDFFIKSSGIYNTAQYRYPILANRLIEKLPPYYRRRIIKNNKLRRMDRAIIKAFCNDFIWLHRLYKPGKK